MQPLWFNSSRSRDIFAITLIEEVLITEMESELGLAIYIFSLSGSYARPDESIGVELCTTPRGLIPVDIVASTVWLEISITETAPPPR